MPSSSSIISMFHRRLALLFIVMVAAVIVLATQLGRLTLVQGAEHREHAEAKLVTLEWTPTLRGPILDRQGRVLAKDRPSFDITVDYRVLSGEWVTKRAGAVARRLNRERWPKLSPEERKELIEQCRVPFDRHLETMWTLFADSARMNRADVDERRTRIVSSIERMYERNKSALITRGIDRRLKDGLEITADIQEEIERAASRRLEEQRAPHVLLPKVDDPTGFAFQKLLARQVEIEVPSELNPSGITLSPPLMEPLMPGVAVVNAGDREYPLDTVSVEMDLGSLPGPMKRSGERARITVEGVGYHILGRVETNAHDDTVVAATGKSVAGHASRRDERLKVIDAAKRAHADQAFAQRVLAGREFGIPERLRDLGRYDYNDDSGFTGIEESHEAVLRGLRGVTVAQLETGEQSSVEAVHGQDVKLTIDAALQARVQGAMSPEFGLAVAQSWHAHANPTVPPGTHLNGAAVVLEVESGDILAMVSTPSMSRARLRSGARAIFADDLNRQVDMPWLNRAIARPYPPGSIVKALMLTGATTLGKLNLDEPIDCTGHLFPNKPGEFRCWIFKQYKTTHTARLEHPLSGPESLMVSCNIYFYTLGQRLGAEGITNTYAMFGLGQPWRLGIGAEFEGRIEPRDDSGHRRQVTIQDAIQMAIGQGPVDWTPLHAADAYATLARGGKRLAPRIVADSGARRVEDLRLDPRSVKEALEGLSLSVNDTRGTGNWVEIPQASGETVKVHHFADLPNIKVWGKTGTAQAPTIFQAPGDPLYDQSIEGAAIRAASGDESVPLQFSGGRRALRWGDHSWFVVLVGHANENRPLYAIAVMMEYAGSGGKVSGPIVAQIIRAMMSEGYL